MCSYNRIGGVYACDNQYTLTEVLRNQWGFQGYVQSDFGATHSTALSLNAGEDFEMQSGTFYSAARINAALADGSLAIGTIDRALTRRYVQMFKFGIFDRPITHTPIDAATAQAHGAVARSIGEQVAVLLKNGGNLLPLPASVRTVALIGQQTFAGAAAAGGGGSSRVAPTYTVTPLQGLQNALAAVGSSATVNLVIVTNNNSNLADATAAAANADITIVMAGVVTSEGSDRPESFASEQPGRIDLRRGFRSTRKNRTRVEGWRCSPDAVDRSGPGSSRSLESWPGRRQYRCRLVVRPRQSFWQAPHHLPASHQRHADEHARSLPGDHAGGAGFPFSVLFGGARDGLSLV